MEYWNSPWVLLNQGRNMLKQLMFGSNLIKFQNGSLQASNWGGWKQLRKMVILPNNTCASKKMLMLPRNQTLLATEKHRSKNFSSGTALLLQVAKRHSLY